MTQDRLNQSLTLSDGRRMGYAEYGSATGPLVFHCHGAGGSRLEQPEDPSTLVNSGVRLIGMDRPGHGLSDPQTGRRLLDWPGDVAQLADHLAVQQFFVQGWSGGGPHALACAYALPDRVRAVATISGAAPPDMPHPYRGLALQVKVWLFLARNMPRGLRAFRRMMHGQILRDPTALGAMMSRSGPSADRAVMTPVARQTMMSANIAEGYRQGWQGAVDDDLAIVGPWGFALEDLRVPVRIWQGGVDRNVSVAQAQFMHQKITGSVMRELPGEAHLYMLSHWADVLDDLLAAAAS